MKNQFRQIFIVFLMLIGLHSVCAADDLSLQPKYGLAPKTAAQKAADDAFLAGVDQYYKGDRKTAAGQLAGRGWAALREGKPQDAIRRFNQAWLIDSSNAVALWGMAVVEAGSGREQQSLTLFAEAAQGAAGDMDFEVDYAKVLFYTGDYASAWEKVKLAEQTPGAKGLDQEFITALNAKMNRPQ